MMQASGEQFRDEECPSYASMMNIFEVGPICLGISLLDI